MIPKGFVFSRVLIEVFRSSASSAQWTKNYDLQKRHDKNKQAEERKVAVDGGIFSQWYEE